MEPIKIKVKSKQLDGSTETADTTMNGSNQFTSENSVEPNPNAGYTKAEADAKFAEKALDIYSEPTAEIDSNTKVISGMSELTFNQKVDIRLERTSDNYIFGTGVYYEYSGNYNGIICTPLLAQDDNYDDVFITEIIIDKATNICSFKSGDSSKTVVFSSLKIYQK